MSKASEYAKIKMRAKELPDIRHQSPKGGPPSFSVCENGDLWVGGSAQISPKEAIEIAHWILETFQ